MPVPFEGLEGKVFYVWFDAPIGYISATKEWADEAPESRDWKSWWTEGNDVKYVQFMAKDNIPFHTIMFPATILGANDGWKNVDYIKGFNWLTFYGGKFSTSQKRGVFTDQALKEFSADYWRSWLMANAPETNDSSFTFSGFAAMINKDLNGILGNYVNRVLKIRITSYNVCYTKLLRTYTIIYCFWRNANIKIIFIKIIKRYMVSKVRIIDKPCGNDGICIGFFFYV